jgi:hypothetical protein
MNVHSLSNRIYFSVCATLDYDLRKTTAGLLSRSRTQMPFRSVMRDDGRGLRSQCQTIKRKPARLLDKLPHRDNRAQNAHGINRSFQHVPALFF